MSESTTSTTGRTSARPGGKPQAKTQPKILGLNRNTVLIGAGVFTVALIVIIWRRRAAAATTAPASTAATTSTATGQSLSAIEQELADLSNSGASTVTVYSTGTGTTGAAPTSTGTGTATATATQVRQYSPPPWATGKKINSTTAQVTWSTAGQPSPQPSSWTVAVYQTNGKLVNEQTVASDAAGGQSTCTISGLTSGWSYHANVWANGGQVAPGHATAGFTV